MDLDSGTNGAGGAGMRKEMVESASGALAAIGTRLRRTSLGRRQEQRADEGLPTGYSRNWKRVTTPKLPPPPRTAQKRSCARRAGRDQAAVGGDDVDRDEGIDRQAVLAHEPADAATEGQASHARRCRVSPNGVASPWAAAAAVYSPAVRPGCAQASRRSASMWRPFMAPRSRTMPPSVVLWPARLWLPPRTAISSSCSRAKMTVRATSAALAARTISEGRRSKTRLWTGGALLVGPVLGTDHGAADAGAERGDVERGVRDRGRECEREP